MSNRWNRSMPWSGGRLARLIAVVLAAGSASCGHGEVGTIAAGATAPGFVLIDTRGGSVALKDLTAHGPVLINFWATWCEPCKQEVPVLNEIYRKYTPLGVTLVAISVEDRRDAIDAFSRRHKVEFPVLLDTDGEVSRRYGLIGLPMNVVVDRNGIVTTRKFGVVDAEVRSALDAVQGGRRAGR
jgi:peroxiredoxin